MLVFALSRTQTRRSNLDLFVRLSTGPATNIAATVKPGLLYTSHNSAGTRLARGKGTKGWKCQDWPSCGTGNSVGRVIYPILSAPSKALSYM